MAIDPHELAAVDPRAAIVRAMIEDLGCCLNSYGQIEYLFGDIVWQAWELPEYVGNKPWFPLSLGGRVNALEATFHLPGPFAPYAADVRLLAGRLSELSEPRHLFVHGHCSFLFTQDGDAAMLFRRFTQPTKGGAVEKYEGIVRPASLRDARVAWTMFASSAQRILAKIYFDIGLEDPGRDSSAQS